ncbi:threonine/homoserine efflux transporter RhtA [Homoserinimonas aerilata]|uniref:Threonine/homoserine efflux transporter RhtA n=1 Tax=Homoserinimonas aerilata TaxID=1162970 RepID=A0A542YHY4_9MICO|nr:DMT family transporter [Homoserinimonas aerilata]TQL47703.1 threonine/homoserine efflux transporter RhtA [Homoserinimonas aerilata]
MGYVYALLAAVLFGVNGSVTKVVVDAGLDPAQLTLFRVAGTAVIAGGILLVMNRDAFRVSLRQLAILSLLGVTGVALLQYFYAVALSRLPVGITLLIEYTAVLMVAVVAFFFFKEKVRARLWVAIGCVLVGLAVVARIWANELDPFGVAMAFGAAVALTIYFLGGEREVGKTSPMAVAFWAMSAATVFWLLFSGWWTLDPGMFGEAVSLGGNLADAVVPLWVPLLWNILLGSFAPFFLSLLALRYLSATAAGVVATAEVIFAFLFAWLWLGEGLDAVQMLGAGVVLVGIVLAQTARVDKVVDADLALIDDPDAALS